MSNKLKSKKYILGKATFSSGSGMPIAFGLNVAVLPLFITLMETNPILCALYIGFIYTGVSIFRLYIIDFVEDRYGLNIRPDYLLGKCWHIILPHLRKAQLFLLH